MTRGLERKGDVQRSSAPRCLTHPLHGNGKATPLPDKTSERGQQQN